MRTYLTRENGRNPLKIKFVPDSRRDIGSGYEQAWQAGRIDLAALSATDLRYGFFEYPVDFIVDDHAFLAGEQIPLIDIMFTLGSSLQSLRTTGSAEIDFTENTYVIRLELTVAQVQFTSTRGVLTPYPSCSLDEYMSGVRSFITGGVEYLELHHPALARNPAMISLRELADI
ncbi:hypothetical protein ACFQ6E_37995 [Streptomyces sp. NPDC056462]|uniref:hypothetical protein n=1 Tax=Streptomyces sp. NPDC056462 TaxID=3345826 RepID=UPI0036CBD3FE